MALRMLIISTSYMPTFQLLISSAFHHRIHEKWGPTSILVVYHTHCGTYQVKKQESQRGVDNKSIHAFIFLSVFQLFANTANPQIAGKG
jgi:hypothetical protein